MFFWKRTNDMLENIIVFGKYNNGRMPKGSESMKKIK